MNKQTKNEKFIIHKTNFKIEFSVWYHNKMLFYDDLFSISYKFFVKSFYQFNFYDYLNELKFYSNNFTFFDLILIFFLVISIFIIKHISISYVFQVFFNWIKTNKINCIWFSQFVNIWIQKLNLVNEHMMRDGRHFVTQVLSFTQFIIC